MPELRLIRPPAVLVPPTRSQRVGYPVPRAASPATCSTSSAPRSTRSACWRRPLARPRRLPHTAWRWCARRQPWTSGRRRRCGGATASPAAPTGARQGGLVGAAVPRRSSRAAGVLCRSPGPTTGACSSTCTPTCRPGEPAWVSPSQRAVSAPALHPPLLMRRRPAAAEGDSACMSRGGCDACCVLRWRRYPKDCVVDPF